MFLPSYSSTKLSFIRDILQNKKKVLKQTEVNKITVPKYEELTVKNLYADAIRDEDCSPYLPDLD